MNRTLSALTIVTAVSLGACSSGSSRTDASSTNAASAFALHGAYVPTSLTSTAPFASITFLSSTTYTGFRNSCVGSGCRVGGSYVFDGQRDLALTDGVSGGVQHIVIGAITTGGTTTTSSLHIRDILAGDGGTNLVSSGGSLLLDISGATMDGSNVQYLGSTMPDPPSPPTGPTVLPIKVDTQSFPGKMIAAAPVVASVMLSVGGSEPVRAILDTGSSGIWVNKDIIPDGQFVDMGSASTGYGGNLAIQGRVKTTNVVLSGTDAAGNVVQVATLQPIAVGEAQTFLCTNPLVPCNATDDNPLGMPPYQAIVGIGLGRQSPYGLFSPIASIGEQSWQMILHAGDGVTTEGTLTIDPPAEMLRAFRLAHRFRLTSDGSGEPGMGGGFLTNNIPFCLNDYCPHNSDPTQGALLDSGETVGVIRDDDDPTEFSQLGVDPSQGTEAQGLSRVPITNVPLALKILGVPVGTFNPGSSPTGGIDRFELRKTKSGNNTGIVAFTKLDVFYDGWNGVIGVAPLGVFLAEAERAR